MLVFDSTSIIGYLRWLFVTDEEDFPSFLSKDKDNPISYNSKKYWVLSVFYIGIKINSEIASAVRFELLYAMRRADQ